MADEIAARILAGDLKSGDRLFEDQLAADLGVSRNPVRESLRALEATGLIEVRPRHGAYVAEYNHSDLAELLEIRALLEGHAAARAAERHSTADLAELQSIIDDGSAATRQGDVVRAATAHRAFHVTIERIAGNQYLGQTVAPLRARTDLVFAMSPSDRSDLSWEEHRRIYDAIAAGDADVARQHVAAHLARVIDDLVGSA